MRFLLGLLLSVSGLWLLGGCQKNASFAPVGTGAEQRILQGDIFSNRPQNHDRFIALIKLRQDPLLAQAQWQGNHIQVDPLLRDKILEEQAKFEQHLLQLSEQFPQTEGIKVLFRYRLVLNALAIVAPIQLKDKIVALPGLSFIEEEKAFAPPQNKNYAGLFSHLSMLANENLREKNSVNYIRATKVWRELQVTSATGEKNPVRGQGIRVGVIDTGIDYTHALLGGPGDTETYAQVRPDLPNDYFPNAKVVGGIDLVGTQYDSASPLFAQHIPHPDQNPLDEMGHGTHVAGTIAGLDNESLQGLYPGVAPEALLYAIKVFGKNGSTGDTVIVAGLEWAVDPNGDLDPSDHLDVVNLSLGESFGLPHNLYFEAMRNLVRAQTVVVASAGNSGDHPYIVGAPSTAAESISVANMRDDMDHNWKFPASLITTPQYPELLVESVEGTITKPIAEMDHPLEGEMVYVGLANKDLTVEESLALQGKVALVDRGQASFMEKMQRCYQAQAIGVVMVNNEAGAPFVMGGEGEMLPIPSIMITQALGDVLKKQLSLFPQQVKINFKTLKSIEHPELIGTMEESSSRGPRSEDSLLKPEVAAPGVNIISAALGSGNKGVMMTGTSMAAPHVAGVVALLKQARPGLAVAQYKSLLMAAARPLKNAQGHTYPLAWQGAGVVDAFAAATMPILLNPASVSLGEVRLVSRKVIRRKLTVTNTTTETQKWHIKIAHPASGNAEEGRLPLSVQSLTKKEVELAPGQAQELYFDFSLQASTSNKDIAKNAGAQEYEAYIQLWDQQEELRGQLPVLAVVQRISQLQSGQLQVHASSSDRAGALAELKIKNSGAVEGEALVFNLLGKDRAKRARSPGIDILSWESNLDPHFWACDLQAAGYRVLPQEEGSLLQIAVKLYRPITTWDPCDISVLIDSDQDGLFDQELVGVMGEKKDLFGLTSPMDPAPKSLLLDAHKMRQLRQDYELSFAQNPLPPENLHENYQEAIVSVRQMLAYSHSTIAILEAPLEKIRRTQRGKILLQVAVSHVDPATVEADDFLGAQNGRKKSIDPYLEEMGHYGMPESVLVPADSEVTVPLTAGADSSEDLLVLYPFNPPHLGDKEKDLQMEILQPKYLFESL